MSETIIQPSIIIRPDKLSKLYLGKNKLKKAGMKNLDII